MERIKIGVLGTGHLGAHHVRILSKMEGADLIGIHEPDRKRAGEIVSKYDVKAFDDIYVLLDKCDAVVIASPTGTHRAVGELAFSAGCHALIEKPLADIASEGEVIVKAAEKAGKILMVGHVEQFNPAIEAARTIIDNPVFVESHRLTAFRGRGTDVSVIHDLLIHDLELLLAIFNGESIESMETSAKSILTDSPDIANSRLHFSGGCVANLTASRISLSNMRKMRFFQQGAYISVDFGERNVEIATLKGSGPKPPANADFFPLPNKEAVCRWFLPVPEQDALTTELEHFLDCIANNKEPRVSGKRGLEALRLADLIAKNAR